MSKTNDQSAKAAGPLAGVRVVDLTQFVLGPYATQTLGDLGADVIKVEEPSGDRQRTSGKAPNSPTMGPVFVALNRNKRSVALDLKTEPGRARPAPADRHRRRLHPQHAPRSRGAAWASPMPRSPRSSPTSSMSRPWATTPRGPMPGARPSTT